MADATFTCDNCGRDFPRDQMKEVFMDGGDRKMNVDPECLDQLMNQGGEVRGVEGDEKQAAVHVGDEAPPEDRETYGKRE